jgi:hypothetical protein
MPHHRLCMMRMCTGRGGRKRIWYLGWFRRLGEQRGVGYEFYSISILYYLHLIERDQTTDIGRRQRRRECARAREREGLGVGHGKRRVERTEV